jgi:hypothetical protein
MELLMKGRLSRLPSFEQEDHMCTDGVSHLIFADEAIMQKMADPILDLVHKQVLMTLYSWDAADQLGEYRDLLPVYLSKDWPECEAILKTIEQAGLVTLTSNGIALAHPLPRTDEPECGCH